MPLAAIPAAIWAGGIAGGASLGGAALASSGAGKAADTQASAALQAAQIQAGTSQQALNFQKQQYATSQQEMAPWLQSGQSALANLNYLLGIGPQNAGAAPQGTAPAGTATVGNAGAARPTTGVQMGSGDQPGNLGTLQSSGFRPGVPGGAQPGNLQALPNAIAGQQGTGQPGTGVVGASGNLPQGYGGQTFSGLTGSGDPNVSPNQQTTAQWKAAGIPFQNITTSDGRTVSIRTDQGGGPQASLAPPQGIQQSSFNQVNPNLGAYGSLSKGWDQTFQAPTNVTEQNDPGFQFRLQQGNLALQKSAAAKGGLLSGGTARDLSDYAQNSASNEYGNVYNRALQTYGTNYNTFSANQANKYNQLASLAGVGQQTASQLGYLGQNTANNAGNIMMQSGNAQASGINNAAAASASGYQNSGNIWGSTLANLGNLAYLFQGQNNNPTTGGV